MNDLTKAIQKTATEAVESTKPVNILFGKVINESPLKINVEQRMVLSEEQLILTRNVMDYTVSITAGNIQDYYFKSGEYGTETEPVLKDHPELKHTHAIDEIPITIRNALTKGEDVILIRQQEGQKYVVIDRLG